VIIGAGPSGLCCAYTLQQLNIPFKLLEMGKCLTSRDRNDSFDSANGAGGAGLFSDGKFSFYPAGTALW
jgi:2-polyprenyl-6-methoxyphenol hydroxylase-like FAD-dependent oxidoreductase